jgi:hypothetical protein
VRNLRRIRLPKENAILIVGAIVVSYSRRIKLQKVDATEIIIVAGVVGYS